MLSRSLILVPLYYQLLFNLDHQVHRNAFDMLFSVLQDLLHTVYFAISQILVTQELVYVIVF